MDVVHVPREIVVVADRMFPIAPLPKRKFAVGVTLEVRARVEQAGTEVPFDASPPGGKVSVIRGQCKDRVQVIGQDHNSIDRKWSFLPGHTKGRAKRGDVIDKSCRPSIRQCQREKEFSALDAITPISHHDGIIPRISLRSSGLRKI